jgi:predicted nuclease of restriction endonuclease-like (RecB) superfamily
MGGFSRTNVFRMRAFYLAYKGLSEVVPQAVGQLSGQGPPDVITNLPWGHNVLLVEKIKDESQRLWYAAKALEHGWSRAVLTVQIETNLYCRQGQAVTNFASTLPPPQSDLAQQALKDPYLFDFLTLHDDAIERDLETGLVDHIQKFLVELGTGFAFVGRHEVERTASHKTRRPDIVCSSTAFPRRFGNKTALGPSRIPTSPLPPSGSELCGFF